MGRSSKTIIYNIIDGTAKPPPFPASAMVRSHPGWSGLFEQVGRPAALSRYKDATPLAAFPPSFIFPCPCPVLHLASSWICRVSLSSFSTIADRRAVALREAFSRPAFARVALRRLV